MVQGFVTLFTETTVVAWIALAVALGCLIAEIFIPSFGLVGISGVLLGIIGLLMNAFTPGLSASEIFWGLVDTILIFGVVLGAIKLIYYFITKKTKGKKKEYLIIDGNKIPADEMGNPDFSFLLNKEGVCVTDLNPSGKVEIDGVKYDVLSEKGYLYNGNRVKVVKCVSSSVYVQKIKP